MSIKALTVLKRPRYLAIAIISTVLMAAIYIYSQVLGIIENCGCAHCANNYVYSVVLDIDKAKQFIILIGLARAAKKGPYGLNAHRLAHELLFNMAEVEEILVELEELEMVKKQGNVFTLGPKSGELLFPM